MANPRYAQGAVTGTLSAEIDAGLKAHMNKVYALMAGAMVLTGLFAYVFGTDLDRLVDAARAQTVPETILPVGLLITLYTPPISYVVMFAPLILCFVMNPVINRASVGMAQMMFWVFGAVMGISLATIFVRFTDSSIAQAFLATAGAFGALSIIGYTTNRDLSGVGVFATMALIGAIVLGLLNMFIFGFEGFSTIVQVVVLLASCALTAYFTQSIKNEYLMMRQAGMGDEIERGAIHGALGLYISFINIFLSLLSLFGNQE
ncbi:MAG: Bax inhibitor-1/YccA family protein [Pseudomonadota bacterium]